MKSSIKHLEPLLFVHIPKAAGSTLSSILWRKYAGEWGDQSIYVIPDTLDIEKFAELPEKDRQAIKLLMGHYDYGFHRHLPAGQATYITMLREPIDRTLSLYYYAQQTPEHYLYEEISADGLTLETIMESGDYPEFYNLQTIFIAGIHSRSFNLQSDELLEAAKLNLREKFAVFGLTERFDESLILLKRRLGWRISEIFYPDKVNVTPSRPARSKISKNMVEIILGRNQLDVELYRYAQASFDDAIRQQGIGFKIDRLLLYAMLRWHAQRRKRAEHV